MLEWVTHILNTLPLQCNPGSCTSSGITANLPQDGTLHRQYNSEFYNVIISSFSTGNTFLQNILIIWNVLSRISARCAFIVESYTFLQVTHIFGYVHSKWDTISSSTQMVKCLSCYKKPKSKLQTMVAYISRLRLLTEVGYNYIVKLWITLFMMSYTLLKVCCYPTWCTGTRILLKWKCILKCVLLAETKLRVGHVSGELCSE